MSKRPKRPKGDALPGQLELPLPSQPKKETRMDHLSVTGAKTKLVKK
jgi:hypothetical protein